MASFLSMAFTKMWREGREKLCLNSRRPTTRSVKGFADNEPPKEKNVG